MSLILRCPICHNELSPSFHSGNGVGCTNNHQFDRAKQGYLNLLPSHKKRSKQPGDDKNMVLARTRFLDSGCYQPVADALIQQTRGLTRTDPKPVILDAGSGEGYYTALLQKNLPASTVCGFDISKPAVQSSCRRHKSVEWLVASVNDIPVADQQCDIIVSVFSRCDWQEFARVLKPEGHVLVLAPGAEHLLALRQAIYEEVRPYPVDKLVNDLPAEFSVSDTLDVKGEMQLTSSQQVMDLLAMTPHYWHVKPEQKEKLAQLNTLLCHFDMKLYIVKKIH